MFVQKLKLVALAYIFSTIKIIFNLITFATKMTNKLIFLFALVFLMLSTHSCVPRKKMVYLQPSTKEGNPIDSIAFTYDRRAYKLQINDIVSVKVHTNDNEVNEYFNVGGSQDNNSMRMMMGGGGAGGDIYYMTGYTINDTGYIDLPVIGTVEAVDRTILELKAEIGELLNQYLKEYYLEVKLGGLRYSALGEFNGPGKYIILQNQATIYEAIANARDLNMVANRSEVRLIRQYPDGTRVHTINLLDQSLIHTPYYFIQPNDVIYVEPLRAKSWGVGITGAQTLTTIISIITSSLSLVLILTSTR